MYIILLYNPFGHHQVALPILQRFRCTKKKALEDPDLLKLDQTINAFQKTLQRVCVAHTSAIRWSDYRPCRLPVHMEVTMIYPNQNH